MLLITTFVELRMVARRSWMRAGHPHAVPWWFTHLMPCCAVTLRSHFQNGMASVNQTWPHCVNQMGKTQSKPLVAHHGRRTAWARHAMCELAFRRHRCKQGDNIKMELGEVVWEWVDRCWGSCEQDVDPLRLCVCVCMNMSLYTINGGRIACYSVRGILLFPLHLFSFAADICTKKIIEVVTVDVGWSLLKTSGNLHSLVQELCSQWQFKSLIMTIIIWVSYI